MKKIKLVPRKGFAAKHGIQDDDLSYVLIGRKVYLTKEWTKKRVVLVRQPEDEITERLRQALLHHYQMKRLRVPRRWLRCPV